MTYDHTLIDFFYDSHQQVFQKPQRALDKPGRLGKPHQKAGVAVRREGERCNAAQARRALPERLQDLRGQVVRGVLQASVLAAACELLRLVCVHLHTIRKCSRTHLLAY